MSGGGAAPFRTPADVRTTPSKKCNLRCHIDTVAAKLMDYPLSMGSFGTTLEDIDEIWALIQRSAP